MKLNFAVTYNSRNTLKNNFSAGKKNCNVKFNIKKSTLKITIYLIKIKIIVIAVTYVTCLVVLLAYHTADLLMQQSVKADALMVLRFS